MGAHLRTHSSPAASFAGATKLGTRRCDQDDAYVDGIASERGSQYSVAAAASVGGTAPLDEVLANVYFHKLWSRLGNIDSMDSMDRITNHRGDITVLDISRQ